MRSYLTLATLAFSLVSHAQPWDYPPAPTSKAQIKAFGHKIDDPYRPLENLRSPKVQAWAQAQNAITETYLGQSPLRTEFVNEITAARNFDVLSDIALYPDFVIYARRKVGQNYGVIYKNSKVEGDVETVLLDPNTWSPDASIRLSGYRLDKDGKRLAYSQTKNGSDWVVWKFKQTGGEQKPFADELYGMRTWNRVRWLNGRDAILYSAQDKRALPEDAPFREQSIYLHKMGTPQSSDKSLMTARKDFTLRFDLTEDQKFAVITESNTSSGNGYTHVALLGEQGELKNIKRDIFKNTDLEHAAYLVDSVGDDLYFLTSKDAPNYKVIKWNMTTEQSADVIAQHASFTLDNAMLADGQLVTVRTDATYQDIEVFDLGGKHRAKVKLPYQGVVMPYDVKPWQKDLYFELENSTQPFAIYQMPLSSLKPKKIWQAEIPGYKVSDFASERIMVPMSDGAMVPVIISRSKDVKKSTAAPALLYAYGCYGYSELPYFDVSLVPWLKRGGIHISAGIRGGGEYGRKWHVAGMQLNKQRSYSDFLEIAQWLIKEGYTTAAQLGASGYSCGGTLAGAALTQKPELFAAVMVGGGILDALRFHLFTGGSLWQDEYGYPKQKEHFLNLKTFSPLQNIKAQKYPAVLVYSGDTDTRVPPLHSFKFLATLQKNQQDKTAPVMLRYIKGSGHGLGANPLKVRNEFSADFYTFLWTATHRAAAPAK